MQYIWTVLKKEFILDFRQKAGIGGVFVYLIAILYTTSFLFKQKFTPLSWAGLYWIIMLFTALIVSYRSFAKEEADGGFFNYLIYKPVYFILGKMIYAAILIIIIGMITFVLFNIFNGDMSGNIFIFLLNVILTCIGLASILSLMGSIASKSGSNFVLMSILSFPLLLPLLLISVKISVNAINQLPISMNYKYIFSLLALDTIVVLLAVIFFPQVWKE